jgi:AGCS family alanine or glycine:cation symporter
LASFGIGSGVQVNAIAKVCKNNLGIAPWIVGIICALLTSLVIFGGVKKIASVCEKLVPFMAIFYVIGCAIILGMNYDFIIPALKTIGVLAFKPGAAAGGLIGSGIMAACRYGIARGLFSNESGMGSAPIVAVAAQTRNPVRQALVSSTGTFWDTVIVCAMTGLVLVSSIMKNPGIDVSNIHDGGELTTLAFSQIPVFGSIILVFGIITFAYSTILGWSYYGERCAEYLLGKKILIPYRILYVGVLIAAPMVSLNLVWDIADSLNALMAIPNLIALMLLSKVIVSETKKYIKDIDLKSDDEIPII